MVEPTEASREEICSKIQQKEEWGKEQCSETSQ